MAKSTKEKSSKSKKEEKVKSGKKVKAVEAKVSKKSKTKDKPKRKVSVITPITEKFTRSSLFEHVATTTGVELKIVRKVYKGLEDTIIGSIVKKGRGEFVWPTLLKVVAKEKPATKERKGTNPFTGEPCIFKAKPKTTVIKVRPLGKLKKAAKGEL